MSIKENYLKLREGIPEDVIIVVAGKTRNKDEILELIDAGATDIGENYVQEALGVYGALGGDAKKLRWHMIGHLQTNKINRALSIFDVVQTVDSYEKALAIDRRVEGRVVSVYVEVNIGGEISKSGVALDLVEDLVRRISELEHLKVEGLMTIEPATDDHESSRKYFRKMKGVFDEIKGLGLPNVDLRVLSMGMSNSYKVAIEEGSNMVRIGTAIFGPRVA